MEVVDFLHSFSTHTDASRYRQELANEYLIANIGGGTAGTDRSMFGIEKAGGEVANAVRQARRIEFVAA